MRPFGAMITNPPAASRRKEVDRRGDPYGQLLLQLPEENRSDQRADQLVVPPIIGMAIEFDSVLEPEGGGRFR